MARFVKFIMGRDLVKWKRMQKKNKLALSVLILRLNRLQLLSYFSTHKLQVNILWSIKNTFSCFDEVFTFSIHLPALSPLYIYRVAVHPYCDTGETFTLW